MLITDAQYNVVYGKVEDKTSLWNRIISAMSKCYRIDPVKIEEQLEKGKIYSFMFFGRHNL